MEVLWSSDNLTLTVWCCMGYHLLWEAWVVGPWLCQLQWIPERNDLRFPHVTQKSTQLKIYELCISGIFHLVFLNYSWLLVSESAESETIYKEDYCIFLLDTTFWGICDYVTSILSPFLSDRLIFQNLGALKNFTNHAAQTPQFTHKKVKTQGLSTEF